MTKIAPTPSPLSCKCGGASCLRISLNKIEMVCENECDSPIIGNSCAEVIREWNNRQIS